MGHIIYIIIPILVFILFYATRREVKAAEKNMDLDHFTVTQSKIFLVVGIICAIVFFGFLVLAIFFSNDTAAWWVYLGLSLFFLFGLGLAIYCATWKLEINNEQITYCPFIGIKKQYEIQNITKIKIKSQQWIKAYSGNKCTFKVDWNCRGYNILIERLQKEQIADE
ncbi:MAG: hypothetical protein LBK40_04420 [Spirochaetaceae bacterium]|nr:hypothetical protein [Spirochaetaceae bacterium]